MTLSSGHVQAGLPRVQPVPGQLQQAAGPVQGLQGQGRLRLRQQLLRQVCRRWKHVAMTLSLSSSYNSRYGYGERKVNVGRGRLEENNDKNRQDGTKIGKGTL